jgi:hypothetical protein
MLNFAYASAGGRDIGGSLNLTLPVTKKVCKESSFL